MNGQLPPKYRVMGWTDTGEIYIWNVSTVLAVAGSPVKKTVFAVRKATTIEMDDYFPYLLGSVVTVLYDKYQLISALLGFGVPLCKEWGVGGDFPPDPTTAA